MNFFANLQSKKNKKNYKILLDIKEDLDQISLKVSILNNKIDTFNKTSISSLDNIQNYISKIHASANKNNLSLCKKGFFKYYRENIIYNFILENSSFLLKEFKIINESLSSIQDEYDILEQNYSDSLSASKFIFKDIFTLSIKDFSNKLLNLSKNVTSLNETFSKIVNSKPSTEFSDLFEDESTFNIHFNEFLKEYNIIL
ncbi:MAG: hypothetical protein ACRDAU_06175 [Clostridium sp.]